MTKWRGRALLLHHGSVGLWASSLLLALGTVGVGLQLLFDGKGVREAPAYAPVRELMSAFGFATLNRQMVAWGVLHLIVGGVALWPLLSTRATTFHRGVALLPLALLWALSSFMFETYAVSHDGTGGVGAVVWLMVAGLALSMVLTKTGAAHRRNQ